jgi:phosphoglycolate phosphatase
MALSEVEVAGVATMVGDRMHDVAGAKQNQMRSIGVTYGYGSQHELESAGVDALADNPDQLLAELSI